MYAGGPTRVTLVVITDPTTTRFGLSNPLTIATVAFGEARSAGAFVYAFTTYRAAVPWSHYCRGTPFSPLRTVPFLPLPQWCGCIMGNTASTRDRDRHQCYDSMEVLCRAAP